MLHFIISAIMTYFLAIVLWYVLCAIGKWKVFEKLGEPGWKAWIPLYSDYILFRATWNTTPFFILLIIAVVMAFLPESQDAGTTMLRNLGGYAAFVIAGLMNIKYARSFNHGYLFAFGLLFLNPIFTIILGFGDSRYIGNTTY